MALVFKDRVRMTTTTTGTGTLTLGSAVTGYQAFSAVGDGNTCYFCIEAIDANGIPTGDWEVSLGTYTTAGTTLSRTTTYASSNSGSAVSLAAGTKHVFVVSPARAFSAAFPEDVSTNYAFLDGLTVTGANIASATTTDIGAATGESVTVTGTTTITGLGTKAAGCLRFVTFSGALILTHNATSLILPTAANITTAAGDTAIFVSLGSGNWKCLDYQRADGTALMIGISALTEDDLATDDYVPFRDTSGSDNNKASISRLLGFASAGLCEGRLTLESGVSVSSTDQTSKTTVYFTPYIGDRIAIYDGTRIRLYVFTELTLALGTLTSGLPYDVFIYDNSGTLTLESLAWTSTTARATALVRQNGAYYKTGALTRRYLGTFITTSTTTTEDSETKRYLYNEHNQEPRHLKSTDDQTRSTTSVTPIQLGSVQIAFFANGRQSVRITGRSAFYCGTASFGIASIGTAATTQGTNTTQSIFGCGTVAAIFADSQPSLEEVPAAGLVTYYLQIRSWNGATVYADGRPQQNGNPTGGKNNTTLEAVILC